MSRARDIANLQSSKITADAGIDIYNINIDGTEIDLSSGSLTIDVAANIILDSDSGEVQLKDNGAEYVQFKKDSDNVQITAGQQDGDIVFRGNDGGSMITALTLDISEAGAATFNSGATFGGDLAITSGTNAKLTINDAIGEVGSGNLALQTSNSAGDALKPMGFRGEDIRFATSSGEVMRIDSNQEVGINITDPINKLHVHGASEAAITVSSGASRGGIFITQPGDNSTIRGSVLVLADTTFRLGTASYYHQEMQNDGTTILNGGGNEALKIDPSGRVTKPLNPVFSAYRDSSATESLTGTIVFNNTRSNVGSHYNTSTGKFTAPVTGNYQFNLVALGADSGGAALSGGPVYITLYHETDSANLVRSYVSGQSGYPNLSFSTIQPLDANDVVRIDVGGAYVYSDAADIWLAFSGFLIG